jgi:hypothetical protein
MAPEAVFPFGVLGSVDLKTPPEVVRRYFETDGAFVVKRLFDPAEIYAVRSAIFGKLCSAGWIYDAAEETPRANMGSRCSDPEPSYLSMYDEVISDPGIHGLPHSGSVLALAGKLGIKELFLLPRIALRMIFPGTPPTPVHQDWTTVKGAKDAATVWVPLAPCDLSTGPVAVIRGSHLRGEQARLPPLGAGGGAPAPESCDRWSTAEFQVGDAVVFRSLTIHGALPNAGPSLRVSMDFRLQDLSQALHPGSLLPPGRFRTWDDVYRDWSEEDRQYACRWRERHPVLTPSISDLRAALASATGTEKRYLERVLRQVVQFS